MEQLAALAATVFFLAILYSSVGHAGASSYLAAMALMSVPAEVMKPTALLLNVVVASIATVRFAAAGCFSWRVFWPFAVTSVPLAYVGGAITLPSRYYNLVVGLVLWFAAARLAWGGSTSRATPPQPAPLWLALIAGGGIGLLAGLTGTGGGIFLSPLLLFAGWSGMKETAGVAAAFVLTNSISGLAGNLPGLQHLPQQFAYLAIAAAVGGLIGSELGSRRLTPAAMKYLLAAVLLIAGSKMVLANERANSSPASARQSSPQAPPSSPAAASKDPAADAPRP